MRRVALYPGAVAIRSGELEVEVTPAKGGDVVSIRRRGDGVEVLWSTPWGGRPGGQALPGGDDQAAWLERYPGGWQVLFPNAGEGGVHGGVRHVFHGEASLAPWAFECASDGRAIEMALDCFSVPVALRRRVSVAGDTLTVEERIANQGDAVVECVWAQHPGFGGDLLAGPGPARIDCGARRVRVDEAYDPPGNRLRPGAEGAWPYVAGQGGDAVDLREPLEGGSAFAYLLDFDGSEGWASLRREDGALGVVLSWDLGVFPVAWLWEELGGSRGWPWFGRGRVVGLEPCTSWPGHGVADVARRTGTQLRLAPGACMETAVRLRVTGARR